jgi:twitching motility protein PilT
VAQTRRHLLQVKTFKKPFKIDRLCAKETSVHTVDLLAEAAARSASDLHIVPNCAPMARIDGELIPLGNWPPLTPKQCVELIYELLGPEQRQRLEKEWNLDFTVAADQMRYRGNAFVQRNGLQAVLRLIPVKIPTPEDLLVPPIVTQMTELQAGLVIVTGPTGSGKSTTMASLINLINQRRQGHIVTIEDPIEFIYTNKKCVVTQREIGIHTPTFVGALKSILRQDPNVVLIGEMRDLETIAATITVAETGHLVFATLHSPDAPQAVERIIDVFPARQQQQIRTQLASVLKGVIAQQLLPRLGGGGRVAAREIMVVSAAIANLIRQGRTHEIYSAIETGSSIGMISMERAMTELARRNLIAPSQITSRQTPIEAPAPRRRTSDFQGPPLT